MAIYHLHAKVIQRSRGKNVVSSAAYRRATKMEDQREGKTWNYEHKHGVIHSEIMVPESASSYFDAFRTSDGSHEQSELLWNTIEHIEKRKDAQLARELEFALPIELSKEQNMVLAREFIRDQFVLRGMIADWSVHWDNGNPHVHVMLTMRELTQDGFGNRVRAWNDKALLVTWRQQWAEYANFHLRLHQHEAKIDHRSYQDQGIELIPTVHQGKAVTDMDRRGIQTEIMREANQIKRENLHLISQQPEIILDKLAHERGTFTGVEVGKEMGRYVNDQGRFAYAERVEQEEERSTSSSQAILTPSHIEDLLSSIEAHHSVFNEKIIASQLLKYTDHADEFAKAMMEIKSSKELIALGAGDDGRDRYTTRRMFDLENRIQTLSDVMSNRCHLKIPGSVRDRVMGQYEEESGKVLTLEQQNAVHHVVGSDAITCVVGRAGTGKSFSLGAARSVWENHGLHVMGIALSGIAASGLAQGSGIPSRTIESFKYAVEKGKLSLSPNDVIVMDETGMTDSRSMEFVLKEVERAKAKLVLVGDHAQLQPVGAGASFRALVERIGFAEIQTIYRQEQEWQREATAKFAAGRVDEALSYYQEKGCIHTLKTPDDAMTKLVSDWMHARSEKHIDLDQLLVLSHRNEDVRTLNESIREARIKAGELFQGYETKAVDRRISLASGDRLLFLKNDSKLGVENGRFGTIEQVECYESGEVHRLTVKIDGSGEVIAFSPSEYSAFDYGYSATVHKTQGITVSHSLIYAGESAWDRHLAYVAFSRHRSSCHLYTSRDLASLQKSLGRLALKDSVFDFPLAFSARRGIETQSFASFLPERLRHRLIALKRSLDQRVRNFFGTNEPINEEQQAKWEADTVRREDARLVAQYVDQHREVGKSWQTLSERLDRMGLKPTDYEAISALPEYHAFQEAIIKRNETAHAILSDVSRYERALSIHQCNVQNMQNQADQHDAHQAVLSYKNHAESNRFVYRDRAAHRLLSNTKVYYKWIKHEGLDTRAMQHHAKRHEKRVLFKTLSMEERASFKVVERYQSMLDTLRESFSADQKEAIPYVKMKHIQKTSQKRDALAHMILSNPPQYEKALDFYGFGASEGASINHSKHTEARWYRLQSHAMRHVLNERIASYIKADPSQQLSIAHEIMEHPSAHHEFVMNRANDPKLLWRIIRRDAKLFEEKTQREGLSDEDKARFDLVKQYVEAHRAHKTAWRELLSSKNTLNLSDAAFYGELSHFAERYTNTGNDFAKRIHADQESCRAFFEYFKIDEGALEKAAIQSINRVTVEQFVSDKNVLEKGKTASVILSEPKRFYPEMAKHNLTWKEVSKYARIYQRKTYFETLSPQERKLERLAARYSKANQAVGKFFSKASSQSKNTEKNREINQAKSSRLFRKRNQSAWVLLSEVRSITSDDASASQWMTDKRVKPDRVIDQAVQHDKQIRRDENKLIVEHFILEKNVLEKGRIASVILSEPKRFYPEMVRHELNWKEVSKYARIYQKKTHFETIGPQERKLERLAARYSKANQDVGKYFSKASNQSNNAEKNREINQEKSNRLLKKRNQSAWMMLQEVRSITSDDASACAWMIDKRIKPDRVMDQALKHEKHIKIEEHKKKIRERLENKHSKQNAVSHAPIEKPKEHSFPIDIDTASIDEMLSFYIHLQVEDTNKFNQMQREKNHDAKKEALKEVKNFRIELNRYGLALLKNRRIQAAFESFNVGRFTSIADRGGFQAVHERIQKGEWEREDRKVILSAIRKFTKRESMGLGQEQERSRGRAW